MVISSLIFLFSIAILWFSSDIVIRYISPIARYFGIREIVVTILGVSVFSSLPELSISLFSALQGNASVSIGNIIGSNFVTLTFVTALCSLISPLQITNEIKDRESSWMILSTITILILAEDSKLSRIDGIIMVVLYIPYIIAVISDARTSHRAEEGTTKASGISKKLLYKSIFFELLAVAGIIVSANYALSSGEKIGLALGIPALALGAILFAFGTSLPEMAIAVGATLKKKGDISMGEIFASNIFTALVVLGICCIASPMTLTDTQILHFDIPMLILAGAIIQIFITTGAKLNRFEALLIMMLYAYYVYCHFVPTSSHFSF